MQQEAHSDFFVKTAFQFYIKAFESSPNNDRFPDSEKKLFLNFLQTIALVTLNNVLNAVIHIIHIFRGFFNERSTNFPSSSSEMSCTRDKNIRLLKKLFIVSCLYVSISGASLTSFQFLALRFQIELIYTLPCGFRGVFVLSAWEKN